MKLHVSSIASSLHSNNTTIACACDDKIIGMYLIPEMLTTTYMQILMLAFRCYRKKKSCMPSSYLMILVQWKRSQLLWLQQGTHTSTLPSESSAVKIPHVSFPLALCAWPYSLFSLTKVIRLQSQANFPHTCVFHSSQKVRRNYCALNSPCQKDDKQSEGGAGSTGA